MIENAEQIETIAASEFMPDDVRDLRSVNWLAKADYRRKDFCYRIKDILLDQYSAFDGYDLQEFTRPVWSDDEYGTYGDEYYAGETFSWHEHILERRRIGEFVFHRPTDHFRYSDINERHKQSPGFDEQLALCRAEKIEGRHDAPADFQKTDGIRSLRRLVHKFKPILRRAIEKPPRPVYPFLIRKNYSDGRFNEFRIRVPNGAAICSGCGAKLITEISNWNLLKIKLGIFKEVRFVYCDSHRDDSRRECPEAILEFRYQMRSFEREPGYQTEKILVSNWAREFFTAHLDEFTAELGLAEWFEENKHEFEEEVKSQSVSQ